MLFSWILVSTICYNVVCSVSYSPPVNTLEDCQHISRNIQKQYEGKPSVLSKCVQVSK